MVTSLIEAQEAYKLMGHFFGCNEIKSCLPQVGHHGDVILNVSVCQRQELPGIPQDQTLQCVLSVIRNIMEI